MKGKRLLLVIVVAASAAAAIGLLHQDSQSEPHYGGLPVSYWYTRYCTWALIALDDGGAHEAESVEPFRAMGTNAVPSLVAWAFNTNQESDLSARFHYLLHWRANDAPFYASPQDKAFCAPYLLRELKPSANLLSDLVQTQLTSTNPVTRKVAIEILGAAGEGSERVVPSLVAGLQDQDPDCVHAAVFALARLGPASAPAVPALATMLKSETIADRRKLLGLALAQIGGAAKPAVPVIQPLFRNETDWYDRCKWAGYLCKIDSNQTEALNFLIDGATNRESTNDAEAAISVLSTIGPNARPAASVCLAILSSPTNDFWSEAAAALEKMNAPKEMYLPALKTRLHSRNDGLTAAKLIFSLDPNDQDAIAVLIQSLRNCGPDQLEVFVELGSAGPMAAPAIPAIEEALKNKEPQIRDVARWGLRQIQTNSAPK